MQIKCVIYVLFWVHECCHALVGISVTASAHYGQILGMALRSSVESLVEYKEEGSEARRFCKCNISPFK